MKNLKSAIVIISRLVRESIEEKELSHVCSYCKKLIKGPKDLEHISHGICNKCMREYFPDIAEEMGIRQEQIEPLPASLNLS